MKLNSGLRGVLEQVPTEQLDFALREELSKNNPDDGAVRLILEILRDREKDTPFIITDDIQKAWDNNQTPVVATRNSVQWRNLALRAASVLLVIGLLFTIIPQEVNAGNILEKIAKWTDSFFSILNDDDTFGDGEYIFKTDNPGLEQLYGLVFDLGVKDPVVPMWLPDGYRLNKCVSLPSQNQVGLSALFSHDGYEATYKVIINSDTSPQEYCKDESVISQHEFGGVTHYIMRNNNRWVVVWLKGHTECFLTIDCQEEELNKILESIYMSEG